ncbi:hypothetical protein GHT06_017476 [Daphnia sinensis]|uniref:Uncharacterized protein n=1 Tax=Daphnia sinensis TaxID=1820382 RepID=A0AAD5L8G7_9CRUS|nr:hypothetical protein GHT06_017476 [Daphnia sinensis]
MPDAVGRTEKYKEPMFIDESRTQPPSPITQDGYEFQNDSEQEMHRIETVESGRPTLD